MELERILKISSQRGAIVATCLLEGAIKKFQSFENSANTDTSVRQGGGEQGLALAPLTCTLETNNKIFISYNGSSAKLITKRILTFSLNVDVEFRQDDV